MSNYAKPNLFVSACIEFDSCRYDGTKISDDFVVRLKPFVNFIKTCPELMIGLSSPRESLRLIERKGEERKIVITSSGEDLTEKMDTFSAAYIKKLKTKNVDGFLLKAKSPSCGISNVRVYHGIGKAHTKSSKESGMFGGAIINNFPGYPIENERRLSNYQIRDRFFTEIFVYAEYREMRDGFKFKDLVNFHSKNKYLFMSYNQAGLKRLGQIVANKEKLDYETVLESYLQELRVLLSKEPSKKRRINVLQHIYGYFKDLIGDELKEYYFELETQYLDGQIPYSNVLALLYSFSIQYNSIYIKNQTIFKPYPKELIQVTDSGKKV